MFSDRLYRGLFMAVLIAAPLATAGSVALAAVISDSPSELDRILIIVNDDVITESELDNRMAQLKRQLAVGKIAAPPDSVLRRQLLERIVVERLQLELADRAGIRVTDTDVNDSIERIARSNKMTVAEFRQRLISEGIDPSEHATEVRTQIALKELVDRQVNERVKVSDVEIRSFLDTHSKDTDVEYNLSHIFIPIPESASPEKIRAVKEKADKIVHEFKDGTNFEKLAVTYSQGEAALTGGNIGWKKPGQLPELFVNALKDLTPGNITDAIRGPNGFHILRLNKERGGDDATIVEQTHARHILIRNSEVESPEEVRAKLLGLRNRVEHGEDFMALAKSHSEDPGSAAKGGDLGWISPGQLVPEFEEAMKKLAPGEVSQPIRTQFGLHIIQVIERRSMDATQERQMASARQQIHARKAEELYEQWVRQLRDEAYVEYVAGDLS